MQRGRDLCKTEGRGVEGVSLSVGSTEKGDSVCSSFTTTSGIEESTLEGVKWRGMEREGINQILDCHVREREKGGNALRGERDGIWNESSIH